MILTYKELPSPLTFNPPPPKTQVFLDGKIIGLIRPVTGGFAYYPKGSGSKFRGETFATLDACKKSLEEPEPEISR